MILKTMLNILLFSILYNEIQISIPNQLPHVPEYQQTLATYMTLVQIKFSVHPPWFRMKLRMFHAIMFPSFILQTEKDFIRPCIKTIICCIISPLIPIMSGLIYWTSITISYISLMYVEYATLFKYKPPTYSRRQYENSPPLLLFNTSQPNHPLPQHYCVLSGVALLPTFTGWLAKLGKTFGGFFTSMNQIGLNSIYFINLNCSASNKILKEELIHKKKIGKVYVHHLMRLFIMIMLYPKLWCTNATYMHNITTQSKDNCRVHDTNQHNMSWDMNTILSEQNIVTNIHHAMCFTTDIDDDLSPLILHNVSKHATSDKTISFTNEETEFGTDNCATHHICSLLSLFISMKTAPKIGVTGVAGSLMASGIGTIQFVLKDDDGKQHEIKLSNVIYLPEST